LNAIGIVAFVVALLVSVMLHEAGHFFTARRFGMKATQFFVGFGPTVWSTKRGETEYGVKAVPAGGFVKIIGMTTLEPVEPGDEDRVFYKQSTGRKTVVLAAGSTMHFIICIVLLFGTLVAFGVPDPTAAVLSKPAACLPVSLTDATKVVPSQDLDKSGQCAAGTVAGVAAAAGLQSGDQVVSANGTKITDYVTFQKLIRASAGKPLAVVVKRGDATRMLQLTPVATERSDLNDPKKILTVGAIGVSPDNTYLKQVGLLGAFPETGRQLGTLITGTYDTITKKLGTLGSVYSKDRDRTGFVGVIGVSRVSGEVFSAPIPFKNTLVVFLFLLAGLNLFVGVFNLLPLLPLDGGHIAVVWFEALRDRVRRLRGHVGEIQRVDYNRLMPVTFAVVLLFAGFSLWLLGADIVNPIRLSQ
jgi:membrane-associated protease RseP (regulator of RpoE activity)